MAAPYDPISAMTSAARARLNDMIESQGGDVFTNDQPFTLQMVNNAWRRLQRRLADLGYFSLIKELGPPAAPWLALPAMTNPDPGVFMALSWVGCFDGTTLQVTPVLPQDLIGPLKLWERATGTIAQFIEMDLIDNGLDAVAKQDWNQQWEWKNDILWMPGSQVATDLRIRYAAYYADFTDIEVTPAQPVPIMQCLDPFSNYICSEMAGSRADLDAATFDAKADAGVAMIANRQSSQARAIDKEAEFGKSRDRFTPSGGG